MRNSLALRLAASAAIWCALLLSAGGYLLAALFHAYIERGFDARLGVLLEGLVAGSELDASGALSVRPSLGEPRFAQPLSGWYWQIDDERGPLARSPSLWDQTLAPPASSHGGAMEVPGPSGQTLRVVMRAINLPGRAAPLHYIVAGDVAEIRVEAQRFERLLALALGALFLGLVAAVLIQVRFGLRPLHRIGRELAAIRAGRARRLEGAFPSEISPLVAELNALLEHSENLVERARTHVGNLAHGLKTPLAVLQNEAAQTQGPLADLVRRQVEEIRRHTDHHLARGRAVASGTVLGARAPVAPVIGDLVRTMRRIYADRGLILESDGAPELTFAGDRQDLEEMIGNLLDNACKWARQRVRVRTGRAGERIEVAVEDDGPGLPVERVDEVRTRGRRLDETKPGSGLGLAIVAEMVELYGGRLILERSPLGGLAARLSLPGAAGEP